MDSHWSLAIKPKIFVWSMDPFGLLLVAISHWLVAGFPVTPLRHSHFISTLTWRAGASQILDFSARTSSSYPRHCQGLNLFSSLILALKSWFHTCPLPTFLSFRFIFSLIVGSFQLPGHPLSHSLAPPCSHALNSSETILWYHNHHLAIIFNSRPASVSTKLKI